MIGSLKSYVEDQVSLAKLEGIEAMGKIISRLVFIVALAIFSMFFLLLLSIAGGIYLGTMYGMGFGFLIMSGIYFLFVLIFLLFKKPIQRLLVDLSISASMSSDKKD